MPDQPNGPPGRPETCQSAPAGTLIVALVGGKIGQRDNAKIDRIV